MAARFTALPAALVAAALLLSGCPCGEEVPAALTAFSGRYGYYVTGPWAFEGALTKEYPDDPEWVLEGAFQFPTSGYRVLAPSVAVAESYPEQVSVRIHVYVPSPGQEVLSVLTEAPLSLTIPASGQAEFDIRFVPLCVPVAG